MQQPCYQLEHLQQCVVAFQGQCSVAPGPPLQQAAPNFLVNY